MYNNEKAIGEAVRTFMQEGKLKREDVFVASKIPPNAQGLEKARKVVEESLERFGLEHIDLMII